MRGLTFNKMIYYDTRICTLPYKFQFWVFIVFVGVDDACLPWSGVRDGPHLMTNNSTSPPATPPGLLT